MLAPSNWRPRSLEPGAARLSAFRRCSEHEKDLAHDLPSHPFVELEANVFAEQRELLHPDRAFDAHDETLRVQSCRLGVARDLRSDDALPGLENAIVVELAAEPESRDYPLEDPA